MALVNIQEKWSSVNGELAQDDRGILTTQAMASRGWTVLFDAAPSGMDAVWATGLPAIGDSYPTYTYLKCKRRRAVPLGPLIYEVICEYEGQDSPLLAAYERSWEDATSDEPTDTDGNGDPLLMPSGERATGLTAEVTDPVYVITRNEASWPRSTMFAYQNRVNSDTWDTDWVANTARMLPIRAQRMPNGASYYYRVTYRIQCRADGWNHRYLAEGRTYLPSVGADPVPVKDKLGVETALLAADGTLLPVGGTPVWITRPKYQSVAFAALGLI